MLSTVNNHSMDKGIEGLYRTLRVIRETGVETVGTYTSPRDAAMPCVVEVNGIKVGFVASAYNINWGIQKPTDEEREYALVYLRDTERMQKMIADCRRVGAEYVIAMVHWGTEHSSRSSREQHEYADFLISSGVDAIIGGHAHVVQDIEWREGEYNGNAVRVPVIYSMGNFITSMNKPHNKESLFVRLTLSREAPGLPISTELAYLPLLCYRDGVYVVGPCYEDSRGTKREAFNHVTNICAGDGITLMDREETESYAGEAQCNQTPR